MLSKKSENQLYSHTYPHFHRAALPKAICSKLLDKAPALKSHYCRKSEDTHMHARKKKRLLSAPKYVHIRITEISMRLVSQARERKLVIWRLGNQEIPFFLYLFGFLTSSSTTRLYRGRAPRQSVWHFYVLPHTRQSWETMTYVSAGHIILTPTQPVGSGRPQRESNPGPPKLESRAPPTELPPPPPPPAPSRNTKLKLQIPQSRNYLCENYSVGENIGPSGFAAVPKLKVSSIVLWDKVVLSQFYDLWLHPNTRRASPLKWSIMIIMRVN